MKIAIVLFLLNTLAFPVVGFSKNKGAVQSDEILAFKLSILSDGKNVGLVEVYASGVEANMSSHNSLTFRVNRKKVSVPDQLAGLIGGLRFNTYHVGQIGKIARVESNRRCALAGSSNGIVLEARYVQYDMP